MAQYKNPSKGDEKNVTPEERLVEAFLPEALGFDAPPDVAAKVVLRVRQREWMHRVRWMGAAAVLLLGVSVGYWKLRGVRGVGPGIEQLAAKAQPAEGEVAATRPVAPKAFVDEVPKEIAPAVLSGAAGEAGCVYGTDDAEATFTLGGYVKIVMTPWTTMIYRGVDRDRGVSVEMLDGIASFFIEPGKGKMEIKTIHGAIAFDGGAVVEGLRRPANVPPGKPIWGAGDGLGANIQIRMIDKAFEGPTEATMVLVWAGKVKMSGTWGQGTLDAVATRYIFAGGLVEVGPGRSRLYPPVLPLPAGEVTMEGAMSWGPSGWTIRNTAGDAYVVMREPDVIANGAQDWRIPPRFRAGWIYRITWVDGELRGAEIVREPSVLYRK